VLCFSVPWFSVLYFAALCLMPEAGITQTSMVFMFDADVLSIQCY